MRDDHIDRLLFDSFDARSCRSDSRPLLFQDFYQSWFVFVSSRHKRLLILIVIVPARGERSPGNQVCRRKLPRASTSFRPHGFSADRCKFLRLRSTNPASDRKSTRLNSSHTVISYAVFCLKKKK